MTYINAIQYIDDTGAIRGPHFDGRGMRTVSQDYLLTIAERDIPGHSRWDKIGYTPTMTTTESDLWSAAGSYVFPPAEMQMEVVSSDNTQDIGSVIFSGTATDGTKFAIEDNTKNFTAGTPVAVGDCIILDSSSSVPEWGYVTQVFSPTILLVEGGFSQNGNPDGREYTIIDKSAYTGAHAVVFEYLDGGYNKKCEIVVLNGTTQVPTANINIFRIQSFRVIAAGSDNKPKGNIAIRETDDSPNYSYISAGYTRARNSAFTVPLGGSLFIVQFCVSFGYSTNQTHYSRIYFRANVEPSTGFRCGSIFYPYGEVVCANTSQLVTLGTPVRLDEKTDLKASGISTFSGIASISLRGWIE